jgi:hypothetical protein
MAGVWPVLFRSEGTPVEHLRAEEPEVIHRNASALNLLGSRAARQVDSRAAEVVSGKILEDGGLLAQYVEFRWGASRAGTAGLRDQDLNDAIRVRIGERFQQHRIHDGKDGRVGADSERQGRDRKQAESGIFDEQPKRVFDVWIDGHDSPAWSPILPRRASHILERI